VDWLARYGGEEFVVVLPDTIATDACSAAEKLRHAVSREPIVWEETEIAITASFGLAGFETLSGDHDSVLDSMLKTADENLYTAKRSGRNRVFGGG
jgi:diguanylate cyclase (GGDEF)-like protein